VEIERGFHIVFGRGGPAGREGAKLRPAGPVFIKVGGGKDRFQGGHGFSGDSVFKGLGGPETYGFMSLDGHGLAGAGVAPRPSGPFDHRKCSQA